MRTTFLAITPQFAVPDVVRTAEYYRDVLGYDIRGYWMDPPVFAIVERNGTSVFFSKARPDAPPRSERDDDGYDAYVTVSSVDAFVAEIAPSGAEIVDGPEDRAYGMREVVVCDCNGLIIAFGEDISGKQA